MAIQTTYNSTIDAARAGMIANTEHVNFVSKTIETAAGVGFGLPVAQGSADNGVVVSSASAFDYVGFTVREQSLDVSQNTDKYSQYDSVRVMTHGILWVLVTDAGGVAAGDAVWVTKATGALSNADAGSGASVNLAGCRWESSGANGALAKIRINMDVPQVAGAA